MKPAEFVAKWGKLQGKESALYASHFDDVCRLVGHPTPTEYAARHDPTGRDFAFQRGTTKTDGRKGFADVYFRDHFIWEYKGPHADLEKAYQQTQLYRESLGNPPLLIAGDLRTIHIHSNFTNRPTERTVVTLDDISAGNGGAGPGVAVLRRVFDNPASFMPPETRENITKATADTFLEVAEALKQHQRLTGETYSNEARAHFLIRLLFCLFAEDLGLLPDGLFTQLVAAQGSTYSDMRGPLRGLFAAMRDGGHFGLWPIRHFNGTLFDDDFVPGLPHDLAGKIMRAARQNWSAIDPSIFGTLFERIIDEDKRAQLGAHYTSRDDIVLIVEPVLMAPLRRRWDEVRRATSDERRVTSEEGHQASLAHDRLVQFAAELSQVRVLDPACGSGNFLYVALRHLLDLQKEVIAYAARKGLPDVPLTVGPQQLYGIEINEYAHELAQITVWIGYLQWRFENGFAEISEPVLRPLRNIRHMDAILAHDETGRPVEPEWPAAEVIVGNPPFLGGYKRREQLGSEYLSKLFRMYGERVPNDADLVCYWYERAREQIATGKTKRAGLLATNSIRGGSNRAVLERIKQTGDIFMAWSDNGWILDGAAVRVSIVGFDDGTETQRRLNGQRADTIHADLTSQAGLVEAKPLSENADLAARGVETGGPFELTEAEARKFRQIPGYDQIIVPILNGRDITDRPRNVWIVDFQQTPDVPPESYEALYTHIQTKWVLESQNPDKKRPPKQRDNWWEFRRSGEKLRAIIKTFPRYIVTPRVAKHRLFVWVAKPVIPDSALFVFARDDDYFFGVLHARPHELWALRMGTWLGVGNDPRYTPTTTFETYPFPWPPGQEPGGRGQYSVFSGQYSVDSGQLSVGSDQLAVDSGQLAVDSGQLAVDSGQLAGGGGQSSDGGQRSAVGGHSSAVALVAEIAHWARALVAWREAWLNPPPPARGTIDVAYDRLIKARTLTNLYNGLVYYRDHPGPAFDRAAFDQSTRRSVGREDIRELDDIHRALDAAVLSAYGWPADLDDEAILERLLELNKSRG